ncbi:hypothetical protein [Streptomyces sp. GC420]|uniref:hypothetical protein n=1 Tax=Streptomyces sp. GC420 TaxID=2697568 RepID=UPI001AA132EA|nr:hypothetical protein [Streptomyces sp. GC420]NBM15817.1 hypothetical protein [Streptomyces sp. GC420]
MTPGDLKASAKAMTSHLPAFPGKDLLFYGGLGALTVAGALEWPVALAIGGATYVVRGRAGEETEADAGEAAGTGRTGEARQAPQRSEG